jgi:hypothetical protein
MISNTILWLTSVETVAVTALAIVMYMRNFSGNSQ